MVGSGEKIGLGDGRQILHQGGGAEDDEAAEAIQQCTLAPLSEEAVVVQRLRIRVQQFVQLGRARHRADGKPQAQEQAGADTPTNARLLFYWLFRLHAK